MILDWSDLHGIGPRNALFYFEKMRLELRVSGVLMEVHFFLQIGYGKGCDRAKERRDDG